MNTERDIRNQIQFAADKGREEGKKEGREEEKILIASKLKAMGIPVDTIIESSGLTREEVEKL